MRHKTIKSLSNPHIKEALDLKKIRGGRKNDAFIIESPHLLEMALGSGSRIQKVFFTHSFSAKADGKRLLRQLSRKTLEFFEIPEHILEKLSDTEAPQGIAAITSYSYSTLDEIRFKDKPFMVAADGIQDPGNLGTLIRTADAAGADAVIILNGTCDAFSPKVIRATSGSIFNVPIVCSEHIPFVEWSRKNFVLLIATDTDAQQDLFSTDLTRPLVFIFGNEAHGVGQKLRADADILLRIPIKGKAESLNVAASAAICLYETLRQRTLHL